MTSHESDGLEPPQALTIDNLRHLLELADEHIVFKLDHYTGGDAWYEVVYPGRGSNSVPVFVVIEPDGKFSVPVAMA